MHWRQTWPDKPNDGLLLDEQGNRYGRVHAHFDGRWTWASWCGKPSAGLADSKEEAKAEVERRADLKTLSPTCHANYDRLKGCVVTT